MTKADANHVLELFAYLSLSAPDFPKEDETNTDTRSDCLPKLLREYSLKSASMSNCAG
jgi:hypothetical protein